MDYFLWSSLILTFLTVIIWSYDIACQYSIHFWSRMTANFYTESSPMFREGIDFTWVIPKFHLPAHIRACWEDFNFNFTRFTGRTEGEGIERNWSKLNPLAGSAKEMGPGAWRDMLEDHMGDMNWKKVIGLGAY